MHFVHREQAVVVALWKQRKFNATQRKFAPYFSKFALPQRKFNPTPPTTRE